MTHWIILWIAAAVLFLLIDMVWLLWLGRGLDAKHAFGKLGGVKIDLNNPAL